MNYKFIQTVQIDWKRVSEYSYIRQIPALQFEDALVFEKNITFFVGENGTGKSTLLEAIRLGKGVYKPEWSYFLRAESFYNVATKEEEYSDWAHPSKEYHKKSHGESFLALAQNSFRPNGLYILDEPEAALSPQRQLTLMIEMHKLAQNGAQFIVASHSPILLGIPDAQILSFDDGLIHACEYTETDSYQVTEMFINNREYLLKRLLYE